MEETIDQAIKKRVCYVKQYKDYFGILVEMNELFKNSKTAVERIHWGHEIKKHAMRNLVQVVEMTSWINRYFAQQHMNHEPDCEEAAFYYIKSGGAKKFCAKWPDIWKDINSSENAWYTGIEFHHHPDFVEKYIHWMKNDGLEKFYSRHPEYMVYQVVGSPVTSQV
jgi:hypothetical protein